MPLRAPALLLGLFAFCHASADGDFDPSFGDRGRVVVPGAGRGVAAAVVHWNGSIDLVNGRGPPEVPRTACVTRLEPDGAVDTAYGDEGDGTACFAGFPEMLPTEYETGAVDAELAPGGGIDLLAWRLAGTTYEYFLASLDPDGDLVRGPVLIAFDPADPAPTSTASALARDRDGRLVVVGTHRPPGARPRVGVARFEADLTPDATFDGDGRVVFPLTSTATRDDYGAALALDAEGRLLVAGTSRGPFDTAVHVARRLADGSADASFGDAGSARYDAMQYSSAASVAVDARGRILIGASHALPFRPFRSVTFDRLGANAEPDPSFARYQVYAGYPGSVGSGPMRAQSPDSRVLVLASVTGVPHRWYLAALEDGVLDRAFGGGDGYVSEGFVPDDATEKPGAGVLVADPRGGAVYVAGYSSGADGTSRMGIARILVATQPADDRVHASGFE